MNPVTPEDAAREAHNCGIAGGQGRSASSVVRSSRVLAWCAVALIVLLAAALLYAKVTS